MVTYHALETSNVQGDYWIVDSGATCHICKDKSLFEDFKSLQKTQEVTLGDRSVLEAHGIGVVTLKLKLPGGRTLIGRLNDVLYVPKLAYNLLSVSKMTEMGKRIHFNDIEGRVISDDGELVAIALKTGNLYYLNCERIDGNVVNATNTVSMESIWHRRYGHLGENNLRKLAKDGLVHGFDYDTSKKIDFCEPCVSGRIHRAAFSGNRTRAKEPLGLIHSDLCGKVSSTSLGGAEYFLTFIDDKSHYVWIYLLKNKHEVFQKFLEWKAMVERSTGHKVKILRSDNGGEYTSNKFEDYLKKEGIRHEYTIPKTPEQNGVSERMNRTLVEKVRSMLIDSKLPQRFWAEALSTAAYLLNRSPTKSLNNKTPFEEWTGEKPRVNHLKIFGCLAYTHIPKDERKKLDSKAKKCIFLGYGGLRKGYRLYDQRSSCVIYSRDVAFNESVRGIEPEQEEKRMIQFESNDDDLVTDHNTDDTEEHNTHTHTDSQLCTDSDTNTLTDSQISTDSDTNAHTFPVTGNEDQTEPVLRRSTRETRRPDHFGVWIYSANATEKEPTTVREALESSERNEWHTAMEKEMESILSNNVWDLVELPSGKRLVGNKWVFKRKLKPDGSVERYKARLVAQGFTQKQGQDYDETFSPVIRFESLRTLIALAVQKGLRLHQMDVTAAFLNGDLKEEVYMKQPEGFIKEGKEHLVCRLKHSLYGLKQSSRCWNFALDSQLKEMGYTQSISDPCIYTSTEGGMSIIGVYVDDIVIAGESTEKVQEVKHTLSRKFNMKDLGELNHFLGVQVIQDHDKGTMWIGQSQYTDTILKKFGMDQSKSIRTPVNTNLKLRKSTEESELADEVLYQSAVGSLLYLSTRTRPDIAYAVGNVARFCSKPTKDHWIAVKRIFRYLKGTTHLGLLYNKNNDESLIGYSDADWGGDLDNYRSTTGYIFQIGGTAVSWKSRKQDCVALSTAEAEYMALACTAQEAVWMRELNIDMNNKLNEPTTIYEDNQSAICMAKNPQFHGRVKHIGIKYHFIREQVNAGSVKLEYCRTEDMIADMFTKGLTQEKFEKLRNLCGIHSQSASEKEC